MKLEHCLLACNENEKYLKYWPSIKRAWNNVIGIPVTMIYIGDTLPSHLENDSNVKLFQPVDDMPTATQAQMIRLLYPAIMDCSGAVVISDMDLMPLNRYFLRKGFLHATEDQFVSLKAPMEDDKQVCMAYVGASSSTWSDFMKIKSIHDVRKRLEEWSKVYISDGIHGGPGWSSDQLELYKRVKSWEEICPNRLDISKWEWDYPRLDRGMPYEWIEPNPYLEGRIFHFHYIDFHMPCVIEYSTQIEYVISLAERRMMLTIWY